MHRADLVESVLEAPDGIHFAEVWGVAEKCNGQRSIADHLPDIETI